MRLFINKFRGMAPRIHQEQLPDDMAVSAVNLDVSEALQGWYEPSPTGDSFPPTHEYFFRYTDTHWFSWDSRTSAVRAPLKNDPYNYVLLSDDDYPKVTRNDVALAGTPYPSVAYRLGMPIPDKPLVAVADNTEYTGPTPESGGYDLSLEDYFDTSYILTFVDSWGRESATGAPSKVITIQEYDESMLKQVTLTLPTVPAGHPLIQSGGKFRIYRMNNASDGSGLYQYVNEVPVTAGTYVDRLISARLQEAARTQSWTGPPDDDTALYPSGPLRNLCTVSEAFLCGHNKHTVCFSEPGVTHAWPVDYYQVFSERVVRAIPYGSDVAVLTDEFPYILTGVHPSSMGRMKMPTPAPCINEDAVAVVAGAVIYAGERGLYALSSNGVELISEGLYDLRQWRNLKPETMKFYVYGDVLFIRVDTGKVLVFDASNSAGGVADFGTTIKAGFTDTTDGKFYFLDEANQLQEFEGSSVRLPVSYESKHFRFHSPVNFIYGRVRAEKFPITITFKSVTVGGTEKTFTKTVTDDRFFYLPAGSIMTEWWVEVSGRVKIRSIALATTLEEVNADV